MRNIGETTVWSGVSGELRFSDEYRESYGLVQSIGGTKAVTSKGGAVPAEGRGPGVIRIATARSSSLMTMGRAAHCAKPRGTLRLGAREMPARGVGSLDVRAKRGWCSLRRWCCIHLTPANGSRLAARFFQSHRNLNPVAAARRVIQTTEQQKQPVHSPDFYPRIVWCPTRYTLRVRRRERLEF